MNSWWTKELKILDFFLYYSTRYIVKPVFGFIILLFLTFYISYVLFKVQKWLWEEPWLMFIHLSRKLYMHGSGKNYILYQFAWPKLSIISL